MDGQTLSFGISEAGRCGGRERRIVTQPGGQAVWDRHQYGDRVGDLNPIEQAFAKLKHLLRKAAARTGEAICLALGGILQAFTPDECANYFANSVYRRT